jgi:hypothetical protein
MNLRLLQQWLDLRTDPWPPTHYRLLGLADGDGEADEVEVRVLQRMEKLRNYQLIQPELVTEGMNRLAQALNCLTDPDARQQYDRSLGLRGEEKKSFAPPPDPVVPVVRQEDTSPNVLPDEIPLPIIPQFDDDDGSPRRSRRMESVFRDRQRELDPTEFNPKAVPPKQSRRRNRRDEAAFLQEEPSEEEPLVLEAMPQERKKKTPKLPPLQLPPELADREAEKPPARDRAPREAASQRVLLRNQYRELVRIRKVIRIWEQIRQALGSVDRETEDPVELVNLLIALQDLTPALPQVGHLIGQPDEPGYVVASFARKAAPLDLLRSMSPSQRESLSQDCRAAHYRLVEAYRKLRGTLRKGREKSAFQQQVAPRLKAVFLEARWLCLLLGSVALLIAAIRA